MANRIRARTPSRKAECSDADIAGEQDSGKSDAMRETQKVTPKSKYLRATETEEERDAFELRTS